MNNKQVRIIAEDEDACILWVSGNVTSIDQVVDWVGGFICPKHDDSLQFTYMSTEPAGSTEGDIIVFLCNHVAMMVQRSYDDLVMTKLEEWGIAYE